MPGILQHWERRTSSQVSDKPHGGNNKIYESAAEKQRAYRARKRIMLAREGKVKLKRRPMPGWQRMRKMRGQRVSRPFQIHMTEEMLKEWKETNYGF